MSNGETGSNHEIPYFRVGLTVTVGLLAFGFAPILVRLAEDTHPIKLATLRTLFAALLLLPLWIKKHVKDRQTGQVDTPGRRIQWLRVAAGVALGVHFTFWISSLYFTSVASASVLVTIHPVMLILIERLFFQKRFPGSVWTGVILAFSGSVLLGYFDSSIVQPHPNPLLGNTLAFTAAALFVIYFLIGQNVRQTTGWIDYVFPVYSYAALTCVVISIIFGLNPLDASAKGLLLGFLLAFGPQILGHGSMNYAVKYISPTILATTILAEPVLGSLGALFLFEEWPPWLSITAMALIIFGVMLSWMHKIRRQNKKGG